MSVFEQAITGFKRHFQRNTSSMLVSAPGRVNLIGEHIDYHDLPVLPVAIQRRIALRFEVRQDRQVIAVSEDQQQPVEASLDAPFTFGIPGDWSNYVRAAVQAMKTHFGIGWGINAYVASDLPPAAGLSSSSALLTGMCLALLRANGLRPEFRELASVLPEAEQLVGTRGGAMDHVAILASRQAHATLIKQFEPLDVDYVPIPANWRFLVAHSLVTAEKSSGHRLAYNAIRAAGTRALAWIGLRRYREAMSRERDAVNIEDCRERDAFLHVTSEARRVLQAAGALRAGDAEEFGRLLNDSHESLRDRLNVSVPAIEELVECARGAGALGARMTGAGFGGCVVCLCTDETVEHVQTALVRDFYARRSGFDLATHLFVAEASAGALSPEPPDDTDENCG